MKRARAWMLIAIRLLPFFLLAVMASTALGDTVRVGGTHVSNKRCELTLGETRLGGGGCDSPPPADDPVGSPTALYANYLHFASASSQYVTLGNISYNGATKATWAFTYYHTNSTWGGTEDLIDKNATSQRSHAIQAQPTGGSGCLSVGIASSSSTMVTCYVPDSYCTAQYPIFWAVSYDGTQPAGGDNTATCNNRVKVQANGAAVTALQNCNGAYPTSMANSTQGITIGATSTPNTFANGELYNLAGWINWAASASEMRDLWGHGVGDIDFATIHDADWGYYIHGDVTPPVCNKGSCSIGGTNPTTGNTLSHFLQVHKQGRFDSMFVQKFRRTNAEPWLAGSGTPPTNGGQHFSDPSCVPTATANKYLCVVDQGTSELLEKQPIQFYSWDTGATSPAGNRAWPDDTHAETVSVVPGGSFPSGTGSSLRLCHLSQPTGQSGTVRTFLICRDLGYAEWATGGGTTCSVTSNSCTCTGLAAGHPFVNGDWIWTTGLTQNIANTSAVQLTAAGATSVSFPMTRSNGTLADSTGTIIRATDAERVQIWRTDDYGASWTGPATFADATYTEIVGVGHAEVIWCGPSRTDWCFGYYGKTRGEAATDSKLARSTNGGVSWTAYATIMRSANRSAGLQSEYPHCRVLPTGVYCMSHCLSGSDAQVGGSCVDKAFYNLSTDGGATFGSAGLLWDCARQPTFIYRTGGHLMIAQTTAVSGGATPTLFRASADYGVTWGAAQAAPMYDGDAGRDMRGSGLVLPDGRIMWGYAQEWLSAPTKTRGFTGSIFRESCIQSNAPGGCMPTQ